MGVLHGRRSTLGFIVLVSIMLHGAIVTPVMRLIDRRRERSETAREADALASAS